MDSQTLQAPKAGFAAEKRARWPLLIEYLGSLLLLIGALAVIYDHYAIYRSNVVFTVKAFKLLKAWTATFGFLVAMAFLTKQSETYSRLLVVQLFVIGYVAQLFLHFAVRELQKRFSAHARLDNALIIGFGAGRDYAYDDFFADAEAVGLTPDLLLSTWDLRPFTPTSSFLVAILRRS